MHPLEQYFFSWTDYGIFIAIMHPTAKKSVTEVTFETNRLR
jgi:hypothetical protein